MTDGNEIEKVLGATIRKVRIERGLSQEKLSELADIDRSYVSEIERGLKTASIRTLLKLSQGLAISLGELCGRLEKELSD